MQLASKFFIGAVLEQLSVRSALNCRFATSSISLILYVL